LRSVLLDITEQKRSDVKFMQLRGQLAHAGRVSMMGQLASALAHELNQPLGAILHNAEAAELFMQNDQPNMEEVRAIIVDIRKDDQRAVDFIDRPLVLLRRQNIESQALSVSQLLEEFHALTRADAAARGVKLVVHSPTDLPLVRRDRVHLQQVLINLIINAMDALGESPSTDRQVRVEASPLTTGFEHISITENDLGIPTDKLSHFFIPSS
jgi:C4-dicarboxylate-specific signal transduction histidine kinase